MDDRANINNPGSYGTVNISYFSYRSFCSESEKKFTWNLELRSFRSHSGWRPYSPTKNKSVLEGERRETTCPPLCKKSSPFEAAISFFLIVSPPGYFAVGGAASEGYRRVRPSMLSLLSSWLRLGSSFDQATTPNTHYYGQSIQKMDPPNPTHTSHPSGIGSGYRIFPCVSSGWSPFADEPLTSFFFLSLFYFYLSLRKTLKAISYMRFETKTEWVFTSIDSGKRVRKDFIVTMCSTLLTRIFVVLYTISMYYSM